MAPRRPPPARLQVDTLEAQGNRCLYCGLEFGWPLFRRHRGVVLLEIHWDHRVPYAYLQSNPADNWVAACQVCNGYKGSMIFPTLDGIRAHIIDKARAHGHEPMPLWDRDTANLGALPPFARALTDRAVAAPARPDPAQVQAERVRLYEAAVRATRSPTRPAARQPTFRTAKRTIDDAGGVDAWLRQYGERD